MSLNISDFTLPKDLERYCQAVIRFARDELDPLADRIDREAQVPEETLPLLRKSGLLLLPYPKEYGGFGLSYPQWYPILEAVAGVGGVIRAYVHGGTAMWRMIYCHGAPQQKEKYLRRMVGRKVISGFAFTEPDAGSGVDIKTTAVRHNGRYVINGRKHLVTHCDTAGFFHVVAYTDRSQGARGISCLLVDRDAPGLNIHKMPPMMCFRGVNHGILEFKDCAVSKEQLLGKEGQGLQIAIDTFLVPSRWSIGVSCLGLAQRLLELSVDFARKRVTFGRPIASRQAVQQMLADMAIQVYALRCAIEDTSRKLDRGLPGIREASMCKSFAIQVARQVSDVALEIHGGIGLSRAYPVERLYREARAMWFEEGSPTIQRLVIARSLLTESNSV